MQSFSFFLNFKLYFIKGVIFYFIISRSYVYYFYNFHLVLFCSVDMAEELCDGNAPLKDPRTRVEYSCDVGQDTCPAGSYCHKVGSIARCCREGGCEGGVTGRLSKVVSQGHFQKWCHRDNLYKNCNRDILKSALSKRVVGNLNMV